MERQWGRREVIKMVSTIAATVSLPLPPGSGGTPYSHKVQFTGGSPPFTSMIVNGSLPPGLTLEPDGTVDGTPLTPGDYLFTVTVTDSDSDVVGTATTGSDGSYEIDDLPNALLTATYVLPSGYVFSGTSNTISYPVYIGSGTTTTNASFWSARKARPRAVLRDSSSAGLPSTWTLFTSIARDTSNGNTLKGFLPRWMVALVTALNLRPCAPDVSPVMPRMDASIR